MEEETVELWVFTKQEPLPTIEQINKHLAVLTPTHSIASQGSIENASENTLQGVINIPDSEIFETYWDLEMLNANNVFKQHPDILKEVGEFKKITHFTVLDDYAFLHVLATAHAILSLQDGMLALPVDNQIITLSRQDALSFLDEEIKEQAIDIIEDDPS